MSKYTTEVRFICENSAGLLESTGYSRVDEVIAKTLPKIFDFDFPIFDESYRSVLETKILKHYYTREIGEETVGLWKLRLNTRLNEIMPYYNKLYESELLSFNPLYDIDLTRDHKVESNGTKVDNGETSNSVSGSVNTTGTSSDNGTTNGETSGTETGTTGGTQKTITSGTETGTSGGTQKTETSGTEKITSSDTITNTNTNLELSSDTPQGSIDNIEDGDHLTFIKKTTNNSNQNNSGSNDKENSSTSETTNSNTNSSETNGSSDTTNTGTSSAESSGTSKVTSTNSSEYNDTTTSSNENSGTSKMNSVISNTEDYLEHVSGKQGGASYSKLLQEYRQTFLNIDMSVIMELKDLFMNLW